MKLRLLIFAAFAAATTGVASGQTPTPQTGLWVGQVAIDQVTELANEAVNPPLAKAGGVAVVRLLIHVDDDGNANLLKDVTVMRMENPAYSPTADPPVDPFLYVLITDPALLADPGYSGVVERKGKLAGLRFSSVAYEFGDDQDSFPLGAGFSVAGTIANKTFTLSADNVNNPYKHKFHPDHREGFSLTRALTFEFDDSAPSEESRPNFGTEWISGSYTEVISGLHREAITIKGKFTLTKVIETGTLNPPPPAAGP